ncbi:NAD(P)-dependent oxidoreductase [Salirhabdus salicampi]|uniref:NAD(P)-dependent oxidoreductase n=1 Tax=Salirhabdus salicampi TaxID=476102 RepID=UPI0020C28CE4|nr:NAD(P)-dependent oxidoreductase [Salirhabdus salicampi]MCP8615827.1 NAD(P)-dependent oxidoreductase [Salirhabdus salicampi]
MKIGLIGLGNIGSGVARCLLNHNYEVVVYDINEERVKELESHGAEGKGNVNELFSDSQFVISSLPNDEIVTDVFLNQVDLRTIQESVTLIELSTISPEVIQEMARHYKDQPLSIIDCPISGGPVEAASGNLNLMVAGIESHINAAKEILNAISSHFTIVGEEIGSAKAVKLINNMMTMGNVLIASEAFAMGAHYGIDQQMLYDTLSKMGGTSHHFVKRFPKVIHDDYSAWFPIQLGIKDLQLALNWAKRNGIDLNVCHFVYDSYENAANEGLANEDIVALTKYFKSKFNNL